MPNKPLSGVSAILTTTKYPDQAPFHPQTDYPEYRFGTIDPTNQVYGAVRDAIAALGLDKAHFGTVKWNPFADFIRPGDHVVIKPNFVLHFNNSGQDFDAVVTHGSVLRPIVDYCLLALGGTGKVTIADAPQMNADFDAIIDQNGVRELVKYYTDQGIPVGLYDLRRERTIYKYGVVWERIKLAGDPLGYVTVDLGQESELVNEDESMFYGADYNRKETMKAHTGGHHEYLAAKTILDADVIISAPKMKVHRKCGVTLNLKNMVGMNGNKNLIIHYQVGSQKGKGDEYSGVDFWSMMDRRARDLFMSGNRWRWGKYGYVLWAVLYSRFRNENIHLGGDWFGNNTIWKAVFDLNRILLYADSKGRVHRTPQRRFFSIIDGIVGGEDEGPLAPTPKPTGLIVAGTDPVSVDYHTTWLMGLDVEKIALIRESLKRWYFVNKPAPLILPQPQLAKHKEDNIPPFFFRPAAGWVGACELPQPRPGKTASKTAKATV